VHSTPESAILRLCMGGGRVILRDTGFILPGVCLRVTILRHQRPWRRSALYLLSAILAVLCNSSWGVARCAVTASVTAAQVRLRGRRAGDLSAVSSSAHGGLRAHETTHVDEHNQRGGGAVRQSEKVGRRPSSRW